jgi:WzyE protein
MSDEAAVLVWCAISALCWTALGSAIALKTRDGLHLGTIFCLLFVVSYPIKLAGTSFGLAVMNSDVLGAEWQLRSLGLANLSAAFFIVPVIVGARRQRKTDAQEMPQRFQYSCAMGWLAAALVLLITSYGLAAMKGIVSIDAWSELREQRDQSRLFSAGSALIRDAGIFCVITHFGSALRRWERLDLARRVGLVLIWGAVGYVLLAVSGSKYMGLLPFAIGLFVANLVRIERNGAGIPLSRTAGWGLLAIVGIGLTGYLRGFSVLADDENIALSALIQASFAFDSPDNLSFILSRVNNWWTGDLEFAPTLQYIFLGPFPRILWPDKPLVMGNLYIMQRYLSERFTDEAGEVISPSMAGEMLVSGGLWFVVVWSLILGIGCILVYRWAQRHRESRIAIAAQVWLSLNVFNLLRSGTGIVAPLVTFMAISSLVLVTSWLAVTISRGAVDRGRLATGGDGTDFPLKTW